MYVYQVGKNQVHTEAFGKQTWLNLFSLFKAAWGRSAGHFWSVYFHQFHHKCQFKISSQLPSRIKTCNHVKSDSMLEFQSVVVRICFQSVWCETCFESVLWVKLVAMCSALCSNYVNKVLNPCRELHVFRCFLTREIQSFGWKRPFAEAWGLKYVDAVWEMLILAVMAMRYLDKRKKKKNRQILCVKRKVELRWDVRCHVSSLKWDLQEGMVWIQTTYPRCPGFTTVPAELNTKG